MHHNILQAFVVFSVVALVFSTNANQAKENVIIAVKYVSFKNPLGVMADGKCCDEPHKSAGSCTPDLCDTSFGACGYRDPTTSKHCDIFPYMKTVTVKNKNSLHFGNFIGSGNDVTPSLFVAKLKYENKSVHFNLTAMESDENNRDLSSREIATFNFEVDWLVPMFLNSLKFRRLTLNSTYNTQLTIDVISQCNRHFYSDDCSVFCIPDKLRYECLQNGTIRCNPGWTGKNCDQKIDNCIGNVCQNNATCVSMVTSYSCVCASQFRGTYCETYIASTPDTSFDTPSKETTMNPSIMPIALNGTTVKPSVASNKPMISHPTPSNVTLSQVTESINPSKETTVQRNTTAEKETSTMASTIKVTTAFEKTTMVDDNMDVVTTDTKENSSEPGNGTKDKQEKATTDSAMFETRETTVRPFTSQTNTPKTYTQTEAGGHLKSSTATLFEKLTTTQPKTETKTKVVQGTGRFAFFGFSWRMWFAESDNTDGSAMPKGSNMPVGISS